MILEKGRVCIVARGRDFGKLCIVESIKDNFVEVDGPRLLKRKINRCHVWPLDIVLTGVNPKEIDKKVKL